jgi:hypothetical protein
LSSPPEGGYLYVVETFGNAIFRVPIVEDGSAGEREEEAHLLCHPTNLGRWHITAVETGAEGLPLYGGG